MDYAAFLSEKLKNEDVLSFAGMPMLEVHKKLREGGLWSAKTETAAADYLGLKKATRPTGNDIPAELLAPLTLPMAKKAMFLPLSREKDGRVTVAIAAPARAMDILDDYRRVMGCEVLPRYMDEQTLLSLINETWNKKASRAEEVMGDIEGAGDLQSMAAELSEPEDLLDAQHDAPVIRLINSVLTQALKEGASDVHIEPMARQVSVRFRVDGVMHTVITPSKKLHAAMTARLKVMAGLDIAEKRLPQDGRFKIVLAGKETDVRVSSLPTQNGERVVLRLLGQQEGIRKLDAIGLRVEQLEKMREFFRQSNGIILVSGPTGSGKTSTLYAGLQEINQPDKNIVTVEDPVEYQLDGIGQIPVNAKIGMTFAAGLRSILRQDPDVVVVGETRDLETAEISIEASLTGHLVLSTIHTNSAAATVTRLLEMGIEPFLVASSLRVVVAQRMVRCLNPATCRPKPLDADTKALFEQLPAKIRPKNITLFEPVPSEDCPTGYKGRTGIFEILTVSEAVRHLIHNRAADSDIEAQAKKEGMLTLLEEGLLKAAAGETTIEEVLRVTRTV